MSLLELAAECADEASADRLFERLCARLGAGGGRLSVAPATVAAPGLGLLEAGCGADLRLYCRAAEGWWAAIPGEALSTGQGVAMPSPPPQAVVVEPLMATDPLLLRRGPDGGLLPPASLPRPEAGDGGLGSAVHWAAGAGAWLEVSAHLLGDAGQMRCLGPTAVAMEVQEGGDGAAAHEGAAAAAAALEALQRHMQARHAAAGAEDGDEASSSQQQQQQQQEQQEQQEQEREEQQEVLTGLVEFTPPPATIVHPDAVAAARTRLMLVADRLGISGAAWPRPRALPRSACAPHHLAPRPALSPHLHRPAAPPPPPPPPQVLPAWMR